MYLVVAQGNPGAQYANTRHNVGFMFADLIASHYGATWQAKPKFSAQVAEFSVDGQRVLLAKPTTFYNSTGQSAQAIASFYKIPTANVLAIHDELALPIGTVRTRIGGSDAGNNGIKSLISHLGPGFARIRVGIANQHAAQADPADYVLSQLTSNEKQALQGLNAEILQFVQDFIHQQREFTHTTVTKI